MSNAEVIRLRFDGQSRSAVQSGRDTAKAIREVRKEAGTANRDVSVLGRSLRTALGISAKVAAGGVLALGGAVAFTGFRFNDLRQKARIAFETMLGSGQKAEAFLDRLAAFAAKTPFEFPELIESSQRLLAMGFAAEEIIPTMTSIGDAVAALGGSSEKLNRVTTALGQIQAKGKATAEEMLQLTEAGIPAWQFLADKIGKSVPAAMELVTKGAINAELTIAAVTEGMDRRFGGLMAKQSRTFSGLLSNLRDTFSQVSGQVMAPFFDLATRGMQKLVDLTSSPKFLEGVRRFSAELRDGLGRTVAWLRGFFERNWEDIREAILGAWDAARLGASIFVGAARAAAIVADVLGGWRPVILALVGAWAAYRTAMISAMVATRVQAVLTARTIRAALLTTGVGAIAAAIGVAAGLMIAHWEKVRDYFARFWNWLRRTAIVAALDIVEPFSHLPSFMGNWARRAKDAMLLEFQSLKVQAYQRGLEIGDALGSAAVFAWEKRIGQISLPGLAPGGDVSVGSAPTTTGAAPSNVLRGAAGSIGPYTSIGGVHPTSGLQGYPALDVMMRPGTTVVAPVGGTVVRISGGPGVRDEKKGIAGWSLYLAGDDGYAYYMTHFGNISVRVGDKIRKGQALGTVFNWGGRTHIHVGVASTSQPSLSFPTPSIPTTPTSSAIDTVDVAATEDEETPADPAVLKQMRVQIKRIRRNLEAVVSPELRARLRNRADLISKAIAGIISEDDAGKVKERLDKLTGDLQDATKLSAASKSARATLKQFAEQIARMPEDARKQLLPKLQKLREALGTGFISKAAEEAWRRQAERMSKAIAAAVDKMKEQVERRRDAFARAFGRVADKALQVFDAKTDELIRRAEQKARQLTPSEARLSERSRAREDEMAARERAELAARIAELEQPLAREEDETDEEYSRREIDRLKDLADARQSLADFEYDQETRNLERQADLERQAAEEQLERERKQIDDERAALRERMQMRIDEITTAYQNEEITADEAQAQLLEVLKEYDVDFAEAGRLIGESFAQAFVDALQVLATTLQDLEAALRRLWKTLYPNKRWPGSESMPEDWWNVIQGGGRPLLTMQHGGRVPGAYIGRNDTVLMRATPGEQVLDRKLSRDLENFLAGGGRPSVVVQVDTLIGEEHWVEDLGEVIARRVAPLLRTRGGSVHIEGSYRNRR